MLDNWEKQFPYLARFCKEQNIERLPYSHSHRQLVLKDYVVTEVPEYLKNKIEVVSAMLDDCLRLAYKHNALNNDRISRLVGNDSIRFGL